ncbi:hypothetical protein DOTSEDRAFT_69280 [Dothistroma septosporum NZE10]|uniref:Uncharacterized protein n=1 Tax=Dothistroma septosporum (strain NZE10 / CBS 128990) TaxID=675120 RepID=N1PYI0_DOTSN|nr:hypothetical protein DOTSEDRAFT_69280 [Dothistroma septosporum NZE10]
MTPNIEIVLNTVSGTKFAGLVVAGVKGISRAYSNLTKWLENALLPSKEAQFETIAKGCLSQASSAAKNVDFFTFVKRGRAALKEHVPQSVFAMGGTMGVHGIPAVSLFFYEGVMDQISPINETDKLFDKYCKYEKQGCQYPIPEGRCCGPCFGSSVG